MIFIKRIMLAIVIIFCLFFVGACSKKNVDKTPKNNNGNDDTILLEKMEPLSINTELLEIEGISVSYIEDEVLKLYSDKIESIEISVVPINDDIISLIKGELIQCYGADIDINKLLKDILITSAIIIIDVVCIVASAPSGGSSAAAGATITAALLKVGKTVLDVSTKASAIISTIGMLVDVTVEGVKAYNEGGDLSYILGHSLNGLVDGIKWSMIFLPFSLGFEKIISTIAQKKLLSKAMNYIDNIANALPNNVDSKAAESIFINSMKKADQILDVVQTSVKSGDITSEVYESIAKIIDKSVDNSKDVGKIIFEMFATDKLELYKLLKTFNPYDNIAKVTKKLQENFLDLSSEAFEEVRKGMVKNTIASLNDNLLKAHKNTILNNIEEFNVLFGSIINDSLKKDIISEFLISIRSNISKNDANKIIDAIFSQLKKDGNLVTALNLISSNNSNNVKNINLITNLFENPGILDILSTCSSAKKFKNFYAQYQVLNNLNIYSDLSDKQLIELFNDVINDKIKTIDELFIKMGHDNATTAKKLSIDYVSLKEALDVLGKNDNHKQLLKSIAKTDLIKYYKLDDDLAETILSSSNYNDEIIDSLAKAGLGQDSYIFKYIDDFSTSVNLEKVLNKTLENANLSKEIIDNIKLGTSILEVFDESQYSTAIKLFNSLEMINLNLGTNFHNNFIKDFNELVIKYFENVVNVNPYTRHNITCQLLSDLGYDSTEVVIKIILANSESAFDIQLIKEVNDIYNLAKTLGVDRNSHKVVDPIEMSIVLNHLFEGNVSSSTDILSLISDSSADIITKNFSYGEVLIDSIKKIYIPNSENLIKNIQILSIADKLNDVVDGYKMLDVVSDVINNNLTVDEIINKYSYKVYYNFVEHGDLIVSKIVVSQNKQLDDLVTKISLDSIYKAINEGSSELTKDMIDSIISGVPFIEIDGLTDIVVVDNYSYIFNYAKATNSSVLLNELVESRTRFFQSLNIVEETLNGEYAGKSYTTILGDVVDYSINGHVILDNYAVASITLELTGNSQKDISKANLLFFGTTTGPQGYTWHHLEDGRTLILVPSSIHANAKHTGGAHYLRNYDLKLKK